MYIYLKNKIDFIFSILFLLIVTPILLISIILIKLESKGPIFFLQERLGLNGKVFKIYKLRTMIDKERLVNVQVFKDNPEVTKVGLFLRRFKIDELPQLINVMLGEMSFVGPRPCLPSLQEKFDENARFRIKVKPGLTGWAQVNGNVFNTWEKRWEMDRFYVERISFLFDIKILFLTLSVILLGEEK